MHFTMSLDGFVAGPNHAMDWMTGTPRAGLIGEYVETTGALICGRDGWNGIQHARPYGGAWQGPIFILTHHPEDAVPTDGVNFLNCDVAEAARIALRAAEGKNVEVRSPSIGRQLLARNLVDEIDLHIAPVLLGAGIRLFDNPAGQPIELTLLNGALVDRQSPLRTRCRSGRRVSFRGHARIKINRRPRRRSRESAP